MNTPAGLSLTVEIVHIVARDTSDIEGVADNEYYIVQDGYYFIVIIAALSYQYISTF